MIDSLLLIGRPTDMDDVVLAALQHARTTRAFCRIEDVWQVEDPVSLIVVLEHWPDEYPRETIHRLLETFPLSRFMVVQGPWCASARRTRQAWPAAVGVPVTEAVGRLRREVDVIAGQRAPLPWTAGMDEIFAFDHS